MPVRPPQPPTSFGPVDQLTTPMIARLPFVSRNAGAPESPAQAPSPALSPLVAGSNSRICSGAGYSGDDERCRAHGAAGSAVAAHGDAVAGNHQRIADRDCFGFAADPHRRNSRRQRLGELDQRDVGRGEMGEQPFEIELRIALDARDVFENRLLSGLAVDELVVGAGLYAMRRRQQ